MDMAELRGGTEPIRVGVVGIGRIGQGVVDQVSPYGVCGCCSRPDLLTARNVAPEQGFER